jgi:PAS domain S-box-containing protein
VLDADGGVDFEQFFVRSRDLMVVADADGYFRLVNAAWRDVLGWELEELRSEPFMSFVHPDDVEETSAQFERQALGESAIEYENRYRCRDGSYRWLQWNASPLDGVIYASARDITSRKELEAELRESEAQSRSVLSTAWSSIMAIDSEGLIEGFNPAAARTFGYEAHEVLGRNVKMLMPEPYHSEHDGYLARYLETGERRIIGISREVEGRRKDGTLFPMELAVSEVEVGSRRGFIGIMSDISERVAAMAEVRESRAAAERANAAKSEFLSRMSHELRTPLNAVLGFAQLLKLDELSAEQRDSVEHITKAARHLLVLIDEVLDRSRVESGELSLSMEPVSLADVVGEAVGMVRPLAAASGVHIDGLGHGGEQHVRADRQRLKQVMVNLLANAVKYNRDGGEVSVTGEAVSDGRIRLVVADTGIGIAEHDLALLFSPFERLGAEQSDVEGTGLGLILTKQLVEAMGGKTGATSQTGVGSSFWVELPVVDAPAEQPADTLQPTMVPAPFSSRARTVLYVEDNPSNVKLVERLVARRPEVTLLVAMEGRIALELAREHQPSLILLDLNLPDVSGEEVLRRLRAEPRTSATPVVVLSADATPGQVQRLRANGATDYLTKPFDIARLLAVIDGAGSADQPTALPEEQGSIAGPLDPTIVASLHDLGRDSEAGPAGINDLVTSFLDASGLGFADLRIAVRDGDAAGVERLAHSLVGSSANLGARNVAEGCREVEARARAGDLGDVPMLVARLEETFTVARTALRAEFLDGGDPSP